MSLDPINRLKGLIPGPDGKPVDSGFDSLLFNSRSIVPSGSVELVEKFQASVIAYSKGLRTDIHRLNGSTPKAGVKPLSPEDALPLKEMRDFFLSFNDQGRFTDNESLNAVASIVHSQATFMVKDKEKGEQRTHRAIGEVWNSNHQAILGHDNGRFCFKQGWAATELLYTPANEDKANRYRCLYSPDALQYELGQIAADGFNLFIGNGERSYILHRAFTIFKEGCTNASLTNRYPDEVQVVECQKDIYIAFSFGNQREFVRVEQNEPYRGLDFTYTQATALNPDRIKVQKLQQHGQKYSLTDEVPPFQREHEVFKKGFLRLCSEERRAYRPQMKLRIVTESDSEACDVLRQKYIDYLQSVEQELPADAIPIDSLLFAEQAELQRKGYVPLAILFAYINDESGKALYCGQGTRETFEFGPAATVIIEDNDAPKGFVTRPLLSLGAFQEEVIRLGTPETRDSCICALIAEQLSFSQLIDRSIHPDELKATAIHKRNLEEYQVTFKIEERELMVTLTRNSDYGLVAVSDIEILSKQQ